MMGVFLGGASDQSDQSDQSDLSDLSDSSDLLGLSDLPGLSDWLGLGGSGLVPCWLSLRGIYSWRNGKTPPHRS